MFMINVLKRCAIELKMSKKP